MSTPELRRRRAAGELIGDALRLWASEWRRLVTIGLVVVLPAYLIVPGLGLEQLWSEYDSDPATGAALIPIALDYLVTIPLIVAMTVSLVTTPGGSRSVGRAVSQGLDAYRSIFWPVLLALLGVAIGLSLLILPGVYLAVRFYFTTWAVLLDRARGPQAIGRSGELVSGNWWRTFGILLLASVVALVPGLVFILPFELTGDATDLAVFSLAGQMLAAIFIYPFLALVGTLLYWDLRERREGAPPESRMPLEDEPPASPPDPPGMPPRA